MRTRILIHAGRTLANGQPQARAEVAADIIPLRTDSEPTPELSVLPVTYFIREPGGDLSPSSFHVPRGPQDARVHTSSGIWALEEEFVAGAYDDLANLCIYCVTRAQGPAQEQAAGVWSAHQSATLVAA